MNVGEETCGEWLRRREGIDVGSEKASQLRATL